MGGRLNLDGGTLNLDGRTRLPYNLNTGYYYYHNWPKMSESIYNGYTAWLRRVARILQRVGGGFFGRWKQQ